MKILALESSTLLGGVAIIEDGNVIFDKSSLRQKSHSEVLNQYVDDGLKATGLQLSDIDVFAVGQGPGSFTGIRVAANIGKTFSYTFNKPLVTVDSLTNLAFSAYDNKRVLTIINAYKNMVYYCLFDKKDMRGSPIFNTPPSAIHVKNLSTIITEPILVVGDGYNDYKDYLDEKFGKLILRPKQTNDESSLDYPLAKTLGLLAFNKIKNEKTLDWKSFVPLYIRASEAEENKQGVVFSPLK